MFNDYLGPNFIGPLLKIWGLFIFLKPFLLPFPCFFSVYDNKYIIKVSIKGSVLGVYLEESGEVGSVCSGQW